MKINIIKPSTLAKIEQDEEALFRKKKKNAPKKKKGILRRLAKRGAI